MRGLLLSLVLIGFGVGACAPYVNIPAQHGDVLALEAPNYAPVRKVMAAGLDYALRYRGEPVGAYAIALPQATAPSSYDDILMRLPPGGVPYNEAVSDLPVYEVAQVSMRAWRGRVDIVHPGEGGQPQLLSTYMKMDWSGWYVYRDRLWRVNVDEALRSALVTSPEEPLPTPAPAEPLQPIAPQEEPVPVELAPEPVEPVEPQDDEAEQPQFH